MTMSQDGPEDCPLLVTLRVSDRQVLSQLLESEPGSRNRVETIGITDPCGADREPVLINLERVTRKQWEALEIAHSLGHYSGDRGGNLAEIADRLDISKSAVSQRLRAAEARIVSAVLGTGRLECALPDSDEPSLERQ